MEKTSDILQDLYSNTIKYANLQVKSATLEVYERITNLIASGIATGFIALFGLFSFLFINFGFAYCLSDLFDSRTYGFLAVGIFYFVVLGLYLLLRHKIFNNKIKNIILLKLSKTRNDYDLMLKEQDTVHAEVDAAGALLKENMEEIKHKLNGYKEDFNKLKSNFVSEENSTVGPKIPRVLMTGAVDLILKKYLLKNSGFILKNVLPVIANTLLTSKVFHEEKKTSLVENLKLKLSKFF